MLAARTEEIARRIAAEQQQFDRQYALTSLSGTTAAQHDRFMRQVNRNSEQWRYSFTKRSAIAQGL
jgi:hypothetical protein